MLITRRRMCIELDLYVVDSRVDRGRDREIIIIVQTISTLF